MPHGNLIREEPFFGSMTKLVARYRPICSFCLVVTVLSHFPSNTSVFKMVSMSSVVSSTRDIPKFFIISTNSLSNSLPEYHAPPVTERSGSRSYSMYTFFLFAFTDWTDLINFLDSKFFRVLFRAVDFTLVFVEISLIQMPLLPDSLITAKTSFSSMSPEVERAEERASLSLRR
ncbi:hypothetical protein BpHYR1_053508 [Brachionus plicatilis]|uniref:Uncharacterized protein n=1 Tax=Brachionus plicatilis TaxID=10195 RepID=A0A3M7S6M3_BRAPC|nr:hypothetical protein BpHYR1_053508 [Brachionus plicatilis]